MKSLSGASAILGVGASSFERVPDRSVLQMAAAALRGALADAELEREAIDGLIVHVGSPRGADYDSIAHAFGLAPSFCSQTWAHGRFAATVLMHAAMAVACGLATRVACLISMKNSDVGRIGEENNPFFHEQFREGGGPHAEEGHIGMASPVAGAAMAFDYYLRRYGKNRELLGAIPTTFRKHAMMTDDAVAKAPMSIDDYRNARTIVEPLRLFDCSPVGDGAICVIVGNSRVAEAGPAPIYIAGAQGAQAGRETFIFAPRGLGVEQQSERRLSRKEARNQSVYAMAGVGADNIDIVGLYDSFSPLPVYALEDFGFCEAGEGLDFIQNGRIAHDGPLPLNTNGGQLSHAQMNGWGQIRELVTQLRSRAGDRQVSRAQTAMWGGVCGDALIFTSGRP